MLLLNIKKNTFLFIKLLYGVFKIYLLKRSTQHLACLESDEKHAQRVFPQLNPLAPGVSEGMWIKVGGNYTNVVLRYDWWTHGDGWLLSERKNVSMRAVQIATKWCNSLNYGPRAINNTTRPVEGLLFESQNRGKEIKGRKGTLSLITVTGRFLLLQAAEEVTEKVTRHYGSAANPKCQASVIYLLRPWHFLRERKRASWGLLHRPLHLIRVATGFIEHCSSELHFKLSHLSL